MERIQIHNNTKCTVFTSELPTLFLVKAKYIVKISVQMKHRNVVEISINFVHHKMLEASEMHTENTVIYIYLFIFCFCPPKVSDCKSRFKAHHRYLQYVSEMLGNITAQHFSAYKVFYLFYIRSDLLSGVFSPFH